MAHTCLNIVQICLYQVYTNTLQHERVCTRTGIFINVCSKYIHVYVLLVCKGMYLHCTYMFMIVNMGMYIVHTRLRLYSSTATLRFSSGQISLATQAPFLQSCLLPSLSSVSCWNSWINPVCACTDLVCTMYIHCIYTFILCMYIHIPCAWVLLIICVYHFHVCPSVPPM